MSPRALAVFDLDGVLSDVRHRLRFLESRPKDWDAFFAAAADDPPLARGIDLAHRYAVDHDVHYLTGRPERTRELTTTWLRNCDVPPGPLHMRPDRDRRPAALFKREQLRLLARTHAVDVVVDDDPVVVDALEADGIPVRLADWIPYQRVLRRAQEIEGRA